MATEVTMEVVENLDFSMLKTKLQHEVEGIGWSREQCDSAETKYKRFLALKKAYPEVDIVPNAVVDAFWHQHILDTRAYRSDCERVFGYFLHHFPYFGMRGDDDSAALTSAFQKTSELYNAHFGEPYRDGVAKCRTQCKPQKCK